MAVARVVLMEYLAPKNAIKTLFEGRSNNLWWIWNWFFNCRYAIGILVVKKQSKYTFMYVVCASVKYIFLKKKEKLAPCRD